MILIINGEDFDEYKQSLYQPKDLELFLRNKGASITNNTEGTITIRGPFEVTKRSCDLKGLGTIINSGIMTVNHFPVLYQFKNLAEGTVNIKLGCVEEIFAAPRRIVENKEKATPKC